MDARTAAMRAHGILSCPDWCERPPDEYLYQQHRGYWTEVQAPDGRVVLRARPLLSWWYRERTGQDQVELEIVGRDGACTARIPCHLVERVRELLSIGEMLIEGFEAVPAYDGATG